MDKTKTCFQRAKSFTCVCALVGDDVIHTTTQPGRCVHFMKAASPSERKQKKKKLFNQRVIKNPLNIVYSNNNNKEARVKRK